jgi:hypothetical protein
MDQKSSETKSGDHVRRPPEKLFMSFSTLAVCSCLTFASVISGQFNSLSGQGVLLTYHLLRRVIVEKVVVVENAFVELGVIIRGKLISRYNLPDIQLPSSNLRQVVVPYRWNKALII